MSVPRDAPHPKETVVLDTNTIWRRAPFQALGLFRGVLGVRPGDPLRRWRMDRTQGSGFFRELAVTLPFGWASRSAGLSQRLLWHRITSGAEPEAMVVTSPHYLPILERVPSNMPTFYYCSDNYRNYDGWPSRRMEALEAEVVRRVDHAWFVSQRLVERAVREYGVERERVGISMNATSERFFPPVGTEAPVPLPVNASRPVAGVVGGVNRRLDLDLLFRCAELHEMGTLLLVGPIDDPHDEQIARLLGHPKVRAVGAVPHASVPHWMWGLDLALIPYRRTEFNHSCSPMRLFDHMASGRPIVATGACSQVHQFRDYLKVAGTHTEFLQHVSTSLREVENEEKTKRQLEHARKHVWRSRAGGINEVIRKFVLNSA